MCSEKATLIVEDVNLLESATALAGDTYEWPFKFNLPEKSQDYRSPFQEPTRLHNDDPTQPLPPSSVLEKDKAATFDQRAVGYGI